MDNPNPRIRAINGDPTSLPTKDGYRFVESGNMQVRIGHDRDGVWIDFGQNVSAFKLNPDQTIAFAKKLEQEAIAAKIGV